jgi:hypothetical protein
MNFTRFPLRSFLIAFTVLAVGFTVWTEKASRQRVAVAELRELGVTVCYDFQVRRGLNGQYERNPRPDGCLGTPAVSDVPASLVNSLGIDYFHATAAVWLYIPRPMDALPFLKRLPELKEVHFPCRGEPNDQADLDQLRKELPGVTVIAELAIVG